jgi:carbon storage regulator
MLVISRRKDEGILISGKDGDIRVVIIEIERGRVRIGIEAPAGYRILREELLDEARRMNILSAIKDTEALRSFGEWKKE